MAGSADTYSFRPGRQRRLLVDTDFHCTAVLHKGAGPHGLWRFDGLSGFGFLTVGIGLGPACWAGDPDHVSGYYEGFTTGTAPIGPDPMPAFAFVMQVELPTGYEQPVNWTDGMGTLVPCAGYKAFPGVSGAVAVDGHLQIWIDSEDWKTVAIDTRTPRGSYLVSSPSGQTDADGIGETDGTYGEGFREGDEWGFALTITGGSSTTGSAVIPVGAAGPQATYHDVEARLYGISGLNAGAASVCSLLATEMSGLRHQWQANVWSDPGCTLVGDANGNLTLSVLAVGTGNQRYVYAISTPPAKFRVDGLVTSMFEPTYALPVRIRRSYATPQDISVSGGVLLENGEMVYSFSMVWDQLTDLFPVYATFTRTINTYTPIQCWIDAAWLSGYGLLADWRCGIADDYVFEPYEVKQNATDTLDALTSLGYWTGVNGTVGGAMGVMTFLTTGGGASVSRQNTPPTPPDWASADDAKEFRYLEVECRVAAGGGGGHSLQLELNADARYRYSLSGVNETWAPFRFDLCVPPGASSLVDTTDHPYVAPGDWFGPVRLTGATFDTFDAVGVTYEFRYLRYARADESVCTHIMPYLPSLSDANTGPPKGTDNYRRWGQAWGRCDERYAHWRFYRRWLDDGTDAAHATDLFQTWLQAYAQWSTTAYDKLGRAAPTPGATELERFYYGHADVDYATREAFWAATEYYPAGVRTNLYNVKLTGAVRAPIHYLIRFDKVTIYPGLGDPSKVYGADDRYPARWTKRLYMHVLGLCADPSNDTPASGVEVREKSGVTLYDTRDTNPLGDYLFRFNKPAGTWTVGTDTSGDQAVPNRKTNRMFRWMGLAAEVPRVGGPVEIASERGWIHTGFGKRIRTRNISDTSFVQESGDHPVDQWTRFRWDGRRGTLACLGPIGGTQKVYLSQDGGTTLTEVLSVVAGSALFEWDSIRGLGLVFYADGASKVWVRQSTDGGTTWAAAVAVQYLGAQLTATLIDSDIDYRTPKLVLAADIAGSVAFLASTDAGLSFSLLLT